MKDRVPHTQDPAAGAPRLALLACKVFEDEIAMHGAANVVETCWFEIGLHDRPSELRASLRDSLAVLDDRTDIDAIVLAYGLCGLGTVGLGCLRHRLVIPRAHDCITVFMGSKEAYADHQRRCPGCFYYTPGWNRARRVPGPEKFEMLRQELAARFDAEDVEFLLESERAQLALHDTVSYLDLGTPGAQAAEDYARSCAGWLGWNFERLPGDPALLRDLLHGNWDAGRFQIIEPGMQLGHSPDESIMRAEPAPGNS
ncbi:MAG TPA: DUF1638 domain-containing protein [Luteolibacter sp.]|nr:DUF1638 domain-containing protein [Luteolibacter sp.]